MYGCAAGATATRRATAGGCGGSEMATRQPPVHTQVSAVLYGEKLRNGAVGATVNALWSVAMPVVGGRFLLLFCARTLLYPPKDATCQAPQRASENRDLLSRQPAVCAVFHIYQNLSGIWGFLDSFQVVLVCGMRKWYASS